MTEPSGEEFCYTENKSHPAIWVTQLRLRFRAVSPETSILSIFLKINAILPWPLMTRIVCFFHVPPEVSDAFQAEEEESVPSAPPSPPKPPPARKLPKGSPKKKDSDRQPQVSDL